MKSMISFAVFTFLLASCAHQPREISASGRLQVIEKTNAIISMQNELEKPSFALDKVVIVRLKMDDKRIETTSLAPTVIVAQPAAGNRTVLNVSDREKLVLFTRDGQKIKGYRMEIPLTDLQEGYSFVFPVAQDPGEVAERKFVVEKVIIQ